MNNVDPDQILHSAASDLGLHSFLMSLLWDDRHKWVKQVGQKEFFVQGGANSFPLYTSLRGIANTFRTIHGYVRLPECLFCLYLLNDQWVVWFGVGI